MQKVVQLAVCSVSCQYGLCGTALYSYWWSHYRGWSFMLEHRLPFNTFTVYPQWIHPAHCLVYILGVSNLFVSCYYAILISSVERNFAWGFFFLLKTIKPSDLKQGGKSILAFWNHKLIPLLVIVRGVYKVIEITNNKSFYYYFLINLIHICINYAWCHEDLWEIIGHPFEAT